MLSLTEGLQVAGQTRYFGPANVVEIRKSERLVLLHVNDAEGKTETWGRTAISSDHELTPGDTVLAAGEDIHNLYVIGLLDIKNSISSHENKIAVKNGAYAEVNKHRDTEKLQVRDRSGELIFEYDPENNKSRVNISTGDLEFVTQKGDISFISARDIRFLCKQSMELMSMKGIRLTVTGVLDKALSSLSIASGKTKINTPDIDINAGKGSIKMEDAKYSGKKFTCNVEDARLSLGRLESTANTVISKAKNVYKTVEGLTQLYTGQLRTLVTSTYHFKSKRAFIKSEEDYKIKAEKIHLG